MEKYAVVLDDEKTKTAGTDKRCPKCGTDLFMDIHARDEDPPRCKKCGSTEYYEKK